ncbi:recombinase RecA [Spiroplasma turonicum]|uniref:Protein RecA n=1 Tax=Spiroplasma turonicum TaxID=216946 RepID=A0A0K1P724_9MOLU|nr:recombinase RecA [Spiroplasma turonicum]AKU80080.1 recombinase A [Spiroplasma turonicum]ALX71082.1 recombinase A [Spiroplasma turonicum]
MIKEILEKNEEEVVLNMSKNVYDDPAFKNVLKEIEKTFGKGSIMKLGDSISLEHESIPTGSFLLDKAVGIGGLPKGRIIEIFGPESSGKTTLSLHVIAESQKLNGRAAFIDAEHALDPKYAKNIGVDINNLIVAQPDTGEQALDILEMLVRSNTIDVVVVDSVAALVPKAELEGEMSDQQIGLQARLMSKALRKLNGIISKTNTIVIFINQLREKVGVIFGNPEITTGGRALRFYSSVRIEVRKGETISTNGEASANKIKVKVVKNKVAPPFKTCQIVINYNKGIDRELEIIEMSTLYNILTKSGVWYSYNDEKIGQGKESVREWFIKNPDKYEEISKKLNEAM